MCSIPENYVEFKDLLTMQNLLVYLLNEFHNICEKNNLIYNIFGGTMLGAVRHGGMIPWDDDIDVTMPRDDYEKLIDIVNLKYKDRFKILHYPDKWYCYPFAKIILKDTILIENINKKYQFGGLYIDVFPVDGYPTKNEEKFFDKLRKYKQIRCRIVDNPQISKGYVSKAKYVRRKILSYVYSLYGMERCLSKEINLVKENEWKTSEFVLCNGAGWFQKGKLEKRVSLDRQLYDFEKIRVWGIKKYDGHLKNLYGDYMSLPPKEKRISPHDYQLYVRKDLIKTIGGYINDNRLYNRSI